MAQPVLHPFLALLLLQSTLAQLNQLDRTLSHRRWDLNRVLAEVAGKPSAHAGSALGREILAAAKAEVERTAGAGSSGSASGSGRVGAAVAAEGGEGLWYEGWRGRLTGEMCHCLVEAERDVNFWCALLGQVDGGACCWTGQCDSNQANVLPVLGSS